MWTRREKPGACSAFALRQPGSSSAEVRLVQCRAPANPSSRGAEGPVQQGRGVLLAFGHTIMPIISSTAKHPQQCISVILDGSCVYQVCNPSFTTPHVNAMAIASPSCRCKPCSAACGRRVSKVSTPLCLGFWAHLPEHLALTKSDTSNIQQKGSPEPN